MAVYGISDVLLFGEGAFKRSGREQSRSLFKAKVFKFTLDLNSFTVFDIQYTFLLKDHCIYTVTKFT